MSLTDAGRVMLALTAHPLQLAAPEPPRTSLIGPALVPSPPTIWMP
ncbi:MULTISPECIES: hypothetical protein [unclassified Micromonospora]